MATSSLSEVELTADKAHPSKGVSGRGFGSAFVDFMEYDE